MLEFDSMLAFVIYMTLALIIVTVVTAFYGFKFVNRHKMLESQYRIALEKVKANPQFETSKKSYQTRKKILH